jgi:hypothetical protein
MAKQSDIDFRVVAEGDVVESSGSLEARESARRLGDVEGSSYTTFEGHPVEWAFDVAGGEYHRILAGAASSEQRVLLIVDADHAFTAMLYGKALVSSGETLTPHSVVLVDIPPEASWHCDSFYVSRERLDGMRDNDVLVVALHAHECSPSADTVETAIKRRTPHLVSSPDPRATETGFAQWMKLVRVLRRVLRLRELDAPEIIIANDVELAKKIWTNHDVRALASWPDDLRSIATELGLVIP